VKLGTNERALFSTSLLVFVALTLAIAVGPAAELLRIPPTPGLAPPTDQVAAGRRVYVAEGCAYCHTQQVRPLAEDRPFGRPSAPGDYVFDRPELLGSERTGPDLTDVGHRRDSDVWNLIHLYEPRAVVPGSVMPAFRWLFDTRTGATSTRDVAVPVPAPYAPREGTVIATRRALDLVAYIRSLKQVPIPGLAAAGASGGIVRGPTGTAGVPPATTFAWQSLGAKVYAEKCAVCHQAEGQGLPATFPPLRGNPVVVAKDPGEHVRVILSGLSGRTIGGVAYPGAMPAWGDQLSDEEVAAVIDHERTSWGNQAPLVTPADVKLARAVK
jgi:cytochrome c oxidase cbb3-type subunit 2